MQGTVHVTAKLAKMRKPQEFIVYPRKNETDKILVQSDKSIGEFDPNTGAGRLYVGKGEHPAFILLGLGEPFQFPAEFVEQALQLKPGAVQLGSICTAIP